jgi:hypothetical protein
MGRTTEVETPFHLSPTGVLDEPFNTNPSVVSCVLIAPVASSTFLNCTLPGWLAKWDGLFVTGS